MTNTGDVEKILDYWLTMEFLNQCDFATSTDWNNLKNKINGYKKNSADKREKINQYAVAIGINFGDNKDIYSQILDSAYKCKMQTWGKLTFYIGRIKRQECIEKIADVLGEEVSGNFKNNQAEKDIDEIAMFSFQCESDGTYVRNTCSLSPILWAISQVSRNNEVRNPKLLSKEAYEKTMRELEKRFFAMGVFGSSETDTINEVENEYCGGNEENNVNVNEQDEMQKFSNAAVSTGDVNNIYRHLVENYGGVTSEENTNIPICIIKYALFRNTKEKRKRNNDDEYTGLIQDFYSDDLSMVKSALINNPTDFESGMLSDLIDYIRAPRKTKESRSRHDFVNPESVDDFFEEMFNILRPKNIPLGKWPSRYRPAFMQQVAINLATSEVRESYFGENGKVFSVNGPPGTGKTTLLKEIIANNVVEKARLLCAYNRPDEAFEEMPCEGGVRDEDPQYYKKWYRFKNDRIADYDILVASCNNAAVENVTMKIPLEDGMRDLECRNDDNDDMEEQLQKIKKLFSKTDTEQRIVICVKNGDKEVAESHKDVYFTRYAQFLFDKIMNGTDAWGLVAAPLGNKQNINNFQDCVLFPLLKEKAINSDQRRIQQYQESRKKFIVQLERVQKIQKELCERADIIYDIHQKYRNILNAQREKEERLKNAQEKLLKQKEELEKRREQEEHAKSILDEILLKYEEICNNIEKTKCDIEEKYNRKKEYEDDQRNLKKDIRFFKGIFMWFFDRNTFNEIRKGLKSVRGSIKLCKCEISRQKSQLAQEKQEREHQEKLKTDASQDLIDVQKKMGKVIEKRAAAKQDVKSAQTEMDDIKHKREECEHRFAEHRNNWGSTLDDDFVSNILTSDDAQSTKAQVRNPWITDEFDRERERLFYLALQVTRNFVLASYSCKTNLRMLEAFWKNHFEKTEDRRAMAGALFQTLFLLTPVVSSTFASIGKMFHDVNEPNVIGTLVIDEAGQASPQYAVGALFRSRKAIIVGDPRQVEPVVTDDLNLLKSTYVDSIYINYKSKLLSVQGCADYINPFGTFLPTDEGEDEWVGCPLLVHRRCISPMYEISNSISYNGIMKQQTILPTEEEAKRFIFVKSRWINVGGAEEGNRDHYVQKQGEWIHKYVKTAFENNAGLSRMPSLFIISPFKSVVTGVHRCLSMDRELEQIPFFSEWENDCIGTIHRFQGKEANEVIFVLGCDEKLKQTKAVTTFVNSNMVNVAVTRAKYRLYMVGDMNTWQGNQYVMEAKTLIDTLPVKRVAEILDKQSLVALDDEKKRLLEEACMEARLLPDATSFVSELYNEEIDANNAIDKYNIDSKMFISSIDDQGFLKTEIGETQYKQFGFSKETFEKLPPDVKNTLLMGIKLYYLLKPVYQIAPDLDTSCCGVLFCRAMEAYLRNNFVRGLQQRFPDLSKVSSEKFMIGKIYRFIIKNKDKIATYMADSGETGYSEDWWESFSSKLNEFNRERCNCCHPSEFNYDNIKKLLNLEFMADDENVTWNPQIGGVFFESEVGKKLEN